MSLLTKAVMQAKNAFVCIAYSAHRIDIYSTGMVMPMEVISILGAFATRAVLANLFKCRLVLDSFLPVL